MPMYIDPRHPVIAMCFFKNLDTIPSLIYTNHSCRKRHTLTPGTTVFDEHRVVVATTMTHVIVQVPDMGLENI